MKQYIITFYDDANIRLLDKFNPKKVHVLKHFKNIVFCEMDPENAIKLKEEKEIKSVEEDSEDDIDNDEFDEQGESYNIDFMQVKKFHDMGITGKGVKIAVMDSGTQKHEDLKIKGGINAYNTTESYHNHYKAHGTRTAGIIGMQDNDKGYLGVAPDCDLYIIKVDDNKGSNNGSQWSAQIVGMNWAIENDIDIINCSFSGSTDSVARYEAFKKASDNGIIICGSAGNKQRNVDLSISTMGYPCSYPFVIASANLTSKKVRNGSSAVGNMLDFSSGGTSVPTTDKDSANEISKKYVNGTGTSYASPAVAGMFGLYKQMFPNDSKEKLIERMYENAEKIGDQWLYGAGIPQFPKEFKNINMKTNTFNKGVDKMQMKQRDENGDYVNMYPVSKAKNIMTDKGESVQEKLNNFDQFDLGDKIKSGRILVNTLEGTTARVDVKFDKPFSRSPMVTATAGTSAPSLMHPIGVSNADENGFTLNVKRDNDTNTWVYWIATIEGIGSSYSGDTATGN